jgi:hypothetical protein
MYLRKTYIRNRKSPSEGVPIELEAIFERER